MSRCKIDPKSLLCSRCGMQVSSMAVRVGECRGRGLGDWVQFALAAIGITKERVEKVSGKPCGCKQRQEALNKLGRQLTAQR